MKAKLFMARLLVIVMLLNSVLPAYAAVNTMPESIDVMNAVEMVPEAEEEPVAIETPSDAELSDMLEIESEIPGTDAAFDVVEEEKLYFDDYWASLVAEDAWVRDGSYYYYADQEDAKITNRLIEVEGDILYLDEDGRKVKNFCELGGVECYFGTDGAMVMGTSVILKETVYTFDGNGAMIENPPYTITKHPKRQTAVPGMTVTFEIETAVAEDVEVELQWMCKTDDAWEPIDGATGKTLTVEVTEENLSNRYHCRVFSETEGLELHSDTVKVMITGWYEFASGRFMYYDSGAIYTGWLEEGSDKYYLVEADDMIDGYEIGEMVTGLQTIDGNLYYFALEDDDNYELGQMYTEGAVTVDGVIYTVNADGTLTASESNMVITKQPESFWGKGDVIEFTVEAVGADSFEWQISKDKGATWTAVTGSEGADYTTDTLIAYEPTSEDEDIETYLYRCVVRNSAGTELITEEVSVHITPVPVFRGTWVETANGLQCVDEDGDVYEEVFAVLDGEVYYLDEDGYILKDEFIYYGNTNVHLYYVKPSGVLAVNHWVSFVDEDDNQTYWRYMQSNGRAARSKKLVFIKDDAESHYAFDDDAIMMTGWVNLVDGNPVYANDWKTAEYYYRESDNVDERGLRATGWTEIKAEGGWKNAAGVEPYWFYFNKSGVKEKSKLMKINDNRYYFDDTGAMWAGMKEVTIDGVVYNINSDGTVHELNEGPQAPVRVNEFDDLAELQTLLSSDDLSNRILVYTGSSDFVVSSDLTVPNYINLQFNGNNLVVDQGVTFTINNWIECDDLIVNGTMYANGHINAGDKLDVNGKLYSPEYNVSVGLSAVIDGLENIVFGDANEEMPWMKVVKRDYFSSMEELTAQLADIKNDPYQNMERVGYSVQIENGVSAFEFSSNITIPAHAIVELCNAAQVSVASGVTVNNAGELNVLVPLYVDGNLVNSGRLNISYDDRFNGTVTLKDNGSYSGDGDIAVHANKTISGVDQILFGFNLDEMFFRKFTSEDGMTHWNLDTNSNNFATFEKLESMIAAGNLSNTRLHYVGNGALTIKNNLTMPKGVALDLEGQDLVIPAGVVFDMNANLDCENITVAGTMNASEWFYANNAITVSGTLNTNTGFKANKKLDITGQLNAKSNSINVGYPGVVNGIDRINFTENWQKVIFVSEYANAEELANAAAALAADYVKHDRISYTLQPLWNNFENAQTTFVIDRDITIPSHAELQFYSNCAYTIAEGKTLTVHGHLSVVSPLAVKGTLVNEGTVSVSYRPNHPYSDDHGTITIGSNGSYSGAGEFYVNADSTVSDINSVLFGFDFAEYDITEDVWTDNKQWRLHYAGGLIKLATPLDLTWGIEYREEWRDIPGTDDFEIILHKFERPGSISWKTARPDQAEMQVKIYRVGETEPCHTEYWGFGEEKEPEYRSVDTFIIKDLDSGSYYFTLQSIGDYKEYRNSDVATSGVYTYVKPSTKLEKVTDLKWVDKDDRFVTWIDWAEHVTPSYVDGYQIEMYYSATVDGEYEQYNGMRGRGNPETESPIDDHFFQDRGDGYYKFKVRALSNNIEEIGNGKWSAFSPVYDTTQTTQKVNNGLNDIIDDVTNSTIVGQSNIIEAVQQMDTQELKTALLVDQENTGATEKLAEIESKVGGAAPVQVTQEAAAFNQAEVSIVGANLNNKDDATDEPITLVVDRPKETHVIPELYNSSVAVSFSMNLENVEDPKDLEVPVKITLPIPTSINPEFLVIFHYDVDGEHELIWPYVYKEGGKWYADFVLTSFSDFIMTTMHDLTRIEPKAPTSTSDGNIEHYVCDCCGKLFADAEARRELTMADVVIPKLQGGSNQDSSEEEYHTSGSKKPAASASGKAELPSYVVSGQWTSVDGKWMFADSTGAAYVNKWAAVENPYANTEAGQSAFDWFFFDANGQMMTGWVFDGGRWYYLNPASDGTQGRMMIGWQLIDGKWYYLNPVSDGTKGAMIADAWIDNYYVDANGVWDETKTK